MQVRTLPRRWRELSLPLSPIDPGVNAERTTSPNLTIHQVSLVERDNSSGVMHRAYNLFDLVTPTFLSVLRTAS